jgi:hypothetical protein
MEMSESGHACIADYSNIYLTSTHYFIGVLPKFELRDKESQRYCWICSGGLYGRQEQDGRTTKQSTLLDLPDS